VTIPSSGSMDMNMDTTRDSSKDALLRELESLRRLVSDGLVYNLFDHVPLPYHSLDVDGVILTVNKAWLEMLGYEIEEVRGLWIGNLMAEESKEKLLSCFDSFKEKGVVDGAEFTMIRKNGSRIIVSIDGRIGYDAEGNLLQTHCILQNVTNKRMAERQMVGNEARFKGLFETSIDGIVFVDRDGTLRDVNPAFCAMLGSDRDHLLGKNVRDIVVAQDLMVSWEAFVENLDLGMGPDELRLDLAHDRGHLVPVAVRFWAASEDLDRPAGAWIMVKDISQSLKAEEALRRSESQYRRIVETANEGIIGLDASRNIVFSNQVFADFLGYDRLELLNEPVDRVFFPEERERMARKIVRQDEEQKSRYECAFRRKDGSLVWGLVSVSGLIAEGGEPTGSFAMVADISERRETEEALHRSQDLLNEAQRISGTGGWDVDIRTGEIFWTAEQCRLHGVEPGYQPSNVEFIFDNFIHPEDKAMMAQEWQSCLEGKASMRIEHRIIRPDGETRFFLKAGIPVVDGDGEVVRVYGSTRDVTEEHESAIRLRRAHQRLLSILDGIDADIYVSDLTDTTVLFMNSHMREAFEVPEGRVRCHEIFRERDDQCECCPKRHLLDKEGKPIDTLVSERFSPKTERWYLNHDRAIEWLEGNLVHMHMATDITELKAMEENLTRAMGEAEAANIAKNEFLANMSHEIRTPLNGLLGMLQILQLTSLVDEQQDCLTTALDSGRNLLQILNDILDLSKIESGMMEFEEEAAELGEILDSVVSVFRHVTESRGVSMSWKIDERLQRHFIVDKGRLRQILFNLVGNAAKFTESGSVVVEAYPLAIPAKDGKARVFFSVTDTGIGMPEDKLDLMFDPFTQLDGSTSRKYQGTGLGLGIVHRLVTMMDGSISISTKEGEGTIIAFTIALSAGACPYRPKIAAHNEGGAGLKILVAEDEHVNRIVVERLLTKLGHEPVCVTDGDKAVAVLRDDASFDCLLTDIQMPGMDGIQTTLVIREELKSNIPIIALTAHAMKGDQQRFMEAGMNGYIAKPFEMDELQQEIERVMAKSV